MPAHARPMQRARMRMGRHMRKPMLGAPHARAAPSYRSFTSGVGLPRIVAGSNAASLPCAVWAGVPGVSCSCGRRLPRAAGGCWATIHESGARRAHEAGQTHSRRRGLGGPAAGVCEQKLLMPDGSGALVLPRRVTGAPRRTAGAFRPAPGCGMQPTLTLAPAWPAARAPPAGAAAPFPGPALPPGVSSTCGADIQPPIAAAGAESDTGVDPDLARNSPGMPSSCPVD